MGKRRTTRKEAKAAGATRYFGKVCAKHPELEGERQVSSRTCVGCRRMLDKQRKRDPEVMRKRGRERYRANRERIRAAIRKRYGEDKAYREHVRAQARKRREINRDRSNLACRSWYEKNRAYALARSREYYEANRDHCLAYARNWRKQNREYGIAYARRWAATNREFMLAYWRKRNAENKERYSYLCRIRRERPEEAR